MTLIDHSGYFAIRNNDGKIRIECFENDIDLDKDYALKAVCQAYIDDKREGLTEQEVFIAHLAGYTVADAARNEWKPSVRYVASDFWFRRPPHRITSTNEEPETVSVPRAELESLKKRIEELEKG